MKLAYQKPELIEMAGMAAFGDCDSNGSGDTLLCYADGNGAGTDGGCYVDGNDAVMWCSAGNGIIPPG